MSFYQLTRVMKEVEKYLDEVALGVARWQIDDDVEGRVLYWGFGSRDDSWCHKQ